MFIDRFTPEELEIIKKELAQKTGLHKQFTINLSKRLEEIFPIVDTTRDNNFDLTMARNCMDTKLYEIIDYTLANVEWKDVKEPMSTTRRRTMIRKKVIPTELEEEYKQMADELIECINKHKRKL